MLRVGSACAVVVALAGCGASTSSDRALDLGRARSSAIVSIADLLTPDLDMVVRIDAARLRESHLTDSLDRPMVSRKLPEGLDLESVLSRAAIVMFGLRAERERWAGDGVLAVEGIPLPDWVSEPAWHVIPGAPQAIRILERDERREPAAPREERSSPVLAVSTPTGWVLATRAEADALLRIVREGPDRARLDPPAEGVASLIVRARPWGLTGDGEVDGGRSELQEGFARRTARGLQQVIAVARVEGTLRLSIDLDYDGERRAATASAELERAIAIVLAVPRRFPPLVARFAETASVDQRGKMVLVSMRLAAIPAPAHGSSSAAPSAPIAR